LYFKITHCYQVYFDVIKALLYILSFALQFSIVMNFRHLINDIYWKLRLFLPSQKQSEFDAACCITIYIYIYIYIYTCSMLLALTEGNQSIESFRGSPGVA